MKTKLLLLACFAIFSLSAQTTHNLDWAAGSGTNNDLTIEDGDTVTWTWTSPNHTVENTPGNSVETFNSGFLGSIGSTFSYTFTILGDNHYFCGVHGAPSMSGTITVVDNLSVNDQKLANFKIVENPVTSILTLNLSNPLNDVNVTIHDVLGKKIYSNKLSRNNLIQLDVSSFRNGFYLISLETDNAKQTKRFIKN